VTYVDLLRGSSLHTYSEGGYGYAVEKAPDTRGWTFTMFEELWNYGFPQEMRHFVECVQHDGTPLETGDDGRAVTNPEATQMLYSMYPTPVRRWIAQRGGLTPRMIFLRGKQLQALYKPCYLDAQASAIKPASR